MSAINIPFDLVEEIIKRHPVKSLLQWRSVSKAFKSLIDSSRFLAAHTLSQLHPHRRLLVSYETPPSACLRRFLSFADDDTFPHHKISPTVPVSRNRRRHLKIIGTSLGLFCLLHVYYGRNRCHDHTAVLWNPSIRKSVAIPIKEFSFYQNILGFGVCPDTLDPKIVKIKQPTNFHSTTDVSWKVEVYALSSRKWRRLTSASCNLPRNTVTHSRSQVVIERFIYWLACKNSVSNVGVYRKQIISFDISNERFGEVDLPNWLECHAWSIFKLRESLAVAEITNDIDCRDVWVMDRKNSFTKLFTIKAPTDTIIWTLDSTKSGEPIIETRHKDGDRVGFRSELAFYELNSEYIKGLGIHAENWTFSVNSYTETLLLHNM